MRRLPSVAPVAALALLMTGCPSPPSSGDGGEAPAGDAGATSDAGVDEDAGVDGDAGVETDAGEAPGDAGELPADAGVGDAGESPDDAGADDAGESPDDAGTTDAGEADAGELDDAGPSDGGADGGDADGGDADGGDADGGPDADAGPTLGDICGAAATLSSTGSRSGSTTGAGNDYDPLEGGCTGYSAAGEDQLHYVALPAESVLALELRNATYDASLYVLDACAPADQVCLIGSDRYDEVEVLQLRSGAVDRELLVVVDGLDSSGSYTLGWTVREQHADLALAETCGETVPEVQAPLHNAEASFDADVSTLASDYTSTCAEAFGASGPDGLFSFVAPENARMTIRAQGRDTILTVWAGTCGGQELACDNHGGLHGAASLTLDVTEGIRYYVGVDLETDEFIPAGNIEISLESAHPIQIPPPPGPVTG